MENLTYLNDEKIYDLINKTERSIFLGKILSCELEGNDIFALHEALKILQYLAKLGVIEFNEERLKIKTKGIEN